MQAALLDFCYAIQIFPKTNPKMWRKRRRYIAMPVSHSSGLNVLFPLFLRCAFPPSTNLSLVLPSLVCLIPPQSCICCLQRMYLLGLITFAFLQQVRVNGGKQRRVFEYFASLGLLFHLYMAGLRPLLYPCHTCIPHTRSAFFFYGFWICFACAEESGNFTTDFNETEPKLLLWQKVTDTTQRASFGDSKTKPGGQPAIPAAQTTEPCFLCEEAAIRAAMAEVTEVAASGRTSSRGAASMTGQRCLARRWASGCLFFFFFCNAYALTNKSESWCFLESHPLRKSSHAGLCDSDGDGAGGGWGAARRKNPPLWAMASQPALANSVIYSGKKKKIMISLGTLI